jgi:hypothetical protein
MAASRRGGAVIYWATGKAQQSRSNRGKERLAHLLAEQDLQGVLLSTARFRAPIAAKPAKVPRIRILPLVTHSPSEPSTDA